MVGTLGLRGRLRKAALLGPVLASIDMSVDPTLGQRMKTVGKNVIADTSVANSMRFRAGSPNRLGGGGCGCITPWWFGKALPSSLSLADKIQVDVTIRNAGPSIDAGVMCFGVFNPDDIAHFACNNIAINLNADGTLRVQAGNSYRQSNGTDFFNPTDCAILPDSTSRTLQLLYEPTVGTYGRLTCTVQGYTPQTYDLIQQLRVNPSLITHVGFYPYSNNNRSPVDLRLQGTITVTVNDVVAYSANLASGDPGWTGAGTWDGTHVCRESGAETFDWISAEKAIGGVIYMSDDSRGIHLGTGDVTPGDGLEFRAEVRLVDPLTHIDSGAGLFFSHHINSDVGANDGWIAGLMLTGPTKDGFMPNTWFKDPNGNTTDVIYQNRNNALLVYPRRGWVPIRFTLDRWGRIRGYCGDAYIQSQVPTSFDMGGGVTLKLKDMNFTRFGLRSLRKLGGGQCVNVQFRNIYWTPGRMIV